MRWGIACQKQACEGLYAYMMVWHGHNGVRVLAVQLGMGQLHHGADEERRTRSLLIDACALQRFGVDSLECCRVFAMLSHLLVPVLIRKSLTLCTRCCWQYLWNLWDQVRTANCGRAAVLSRWLTVQRYVYRGHAGSVGALVA